MKKGFCVSSILVLLGGVLVGCPPARCTIPVITSFAINGGASDTTSLTVTLDNVCTGSPTQYMASESPSFTGASWHTYTTAPSFTLSSGEGAKTIYFRVKNRSGTSATVNDTVTLTAGGATEETVMLPGNVPLEMAWCPAGTFMMGAPANELDAWDADRPQHQVTLTHGFWMGKYELTKRQWVAVMSTTPWSGGSYVLADPDSPAVYVSWNDAQAFITALNTYTGKTFRLPSEAEWEYACRAGTTTRFYWGDDLSCTQTGSYAWYWSNCSSEMYAHVVGQKLPNAFGLYDMSGNVLEWVQDWWAYYANSNAVTDPTGPATGEGRVERGGSWDHDGGYYCRSALRYYNNPSNAFDFIGFRLSR